MIALASENTSILPYYVVRCRDDLCDKRLRCLRWLERDCSCVGSVRSMRVTKRGCIHYIHDETAYDD